MKTFRTLFLVIAILSGLNIASIAEEPSKPLNSETTLHKSSSTKIPKSVIPEVMECYYEYGILCFDVDIDMTNVSVVITDIYNNISQQFHLKHLFQMKYISRQVRYMFEILLRYRYI